MFIGLGVKLPWAGRCLGGWVLGSNLFGQTKQTVSISTAVPVALT